MERIYDNELIAILPIYQKDYGDSTKVILKDSSVILNKNVLTVINLLTQYYMVDMEEVKKMYGGLLNTKILFPIPFDEKNIFANIKSRKPLCKNDRAFGFVNLKFIKNIEPKDNHTLIYLTNGKKLESFAKIDTTQNHITDANIIKEFQLKRKMGQKNEPIKDDLNDLYNNAYKEISEFNEDCNIDIDFLILLLIYLLNNR